GALEEHEHDVGRGVRDDLHVEVAVVGGHEGEHLVGAAAVRLVVVGAELTALAGDVVREAAQVAAAGPSAGAVRGERDGLVARLAARRDRHARAGVARLLEAAAAGAAATVAVATGAGRAGRRAARVR